MPLAGLALRCSLVAGCVRPRDAAQTPSSRRLAFPRGRGSGTKLRLLLCSKVSLSFLALSFCAGTSSCLVKASIVAKTGIPEKQHPLDSPWSRRYKTWYWTRPWAADTQATDSSSDSSESCAPAWNVHALHAGVVAGAVLPKASSSCIGV